MQISLHAIVERVQSGGRYHNYLFEEGSFNIENYQLVEKEKVEENSNVSRSNKCKTHCCDLNASPKFHIRYFKIMVSPLSLSTMCCTGNP